MKIAFVTPAYHPATIGAAGYCTELAERLTKKGDTVKVFTPLQEGLARKETINGIDVVRPPVTRLTGSYYISSDMVREVLKEKFDIIHSHHYGYFPATAGFIAARMSKTPHVFGPYYHPPVYGLGRMALYMAYHATQGMPVLKFSDRVLPHTRYEEDILVKAGGRKEAMRILPNIADTRRFKPGRRKENTVLFVSNFLREKGADVAMDLAEKHQDIKFIFVGNAHDRSLAPRIDKLKKKKNVTFMSNLPLSSLIKLYQKASVLVLPSKYEAFSRVIAEAQACGCAVVSTRVGAIPEVVEDGKSGFLVNYGDWKSLDERVVELIGNRNKAEAMGRRGRKNVVEKFDSEIVVKKLQKIYHELA